MTDRYWFGRVERQVPAGGLCSSLVSLQVMLRSSQPLVLFSELRFPLEKFGLSLRRMLFQTLSEPGQNQDHQREYHQKTGLDRNGDLSSVGRAYEGDRSASNQTTKQGQEDRDEDNSAPDDTGRHSLWLRPPGNEEDRRYLQAQQQTEKRCEDDLNILVLQDRRSTFGHSWLPRPCYSPLPRLDAALLPQSSGTSRFSSRPPRFESWRAQRFCGWGSAVATTRRRGRLAPAQT